MPESLRQNAEIWKRDLMAALSSGKSRQIKKCINRYRKVDIREALEKMYRGLCCYCESRIIGVAFSHIEHRRPKSVQPEYAFDWDNLHLACQKCNHAKGSKWDECHQILDSAQDAISEHLNYIFGEGGLKRWPETHRGETTIDHANLNRLALVENRTELTRIILLLIDILNEDPNAPRAERIVVELQEKTSWEFGSMIKWLSHRNIHPDLLVLFE